MTFRKLCCRNGRIIVLSAIGQPYWAELFANQQGLYSIHINSWLNNSSIRKFKLKTKAPIPVGEALGEDRRLRDILSAPVCDDVNETELLGQGVADLSVWRNIEMNAVTTWLQAVRNSPKWHDQARHSSL